MPDARINGVRIWYKETGQGEPVIQIHGSGFGHFNFATATPILSRNFRCIDFDMRGYGESERPSQQYSMEVWADDVAGKKQRARSMAGSTDPGPELGGVSIPFVMSCDARPESDSAESVRSNLA